ncbi:MAG: DUF3307 domain-containing protein [Anaerolineae bacterium]|nr:DUF3307 domain-containing protein [Anaerolineae bacterium]
MITSMFLAHFIGDFVLQWDSLAQWKGRAYSGVLAHCLVVFLVTWLFSLPFGAAFWPWVLFIGLGHLLIDLGQLFVARQFPALQTGHYALARFLTDQMLHLMIILAALVGSGYLHLETAGPEIWAALQNNRFWTLALAYSFVTMPAWILVKFTIYGLINDGPPNLSQLRHDKYVCILERLLITTLVFTGAILLVPFVPLVRVLLEQAEVKERGRTTLYVAELLSSVLLAVLVGLALRTVWLGTV